MMMENLPGAYVSRMKGMLKGEFEEFLCCYEKKPFRGLRLNPLKCDMETLRASLPFTLEAAPFSTLSFYLPQEAGKVGFYPLHHAGAFYVQEPSAASAVTVLSPCPGDRVLDLCAAPGGKSTQIAAMLCGEGLLWSNEVIRNRAAVLLSNIERLGVKNAVVSSCRPDILCDGLAGFFDKVLVDAPCSGEGMFRRDAKAVEEWSTAHVSACAIRQRAILKSAAQALREGGVLVYSTCTFSPEENEEAVLSFLEENPGFVLEECDVPFGRPAAVPQARRIYPMDGGEGHFVAKFRRQASNSRTPASYPYQKSSREGARLCRELFFNPPDRPIEEMGGKLYLLPDGLPTCRGLGVLRAGVCMGDLRGGRVEPGHALFMASKPEELRNVLRLPGDSPRLQAFLRGEELATPELSRGYAGVSAEGILTGFGKCSDGRLKNRYPKGLRNHV